MTLNLREKLQALRQQYASRPPRDLPAGKSVWIFGTGQFDRDLCGALQKLGHPVAGFVETKPSAPEVMGLPVLDCAQWTGAHSAAPLCLGILNRGMPLDQLKALAQKSGAQNVYLPWNFYRSLKPQMCWRFWLSEPERILGQIDAFASALNCMDEAVSHRCMISEAHTSRLLVYMDRIPGSEMQGIADSNPNREGKHMEHSTVRAPSSIQESPEVAVLVSSFRSREAIAAHLRKTAPNPLVLLYH